MNPEDFDSFVSGFNLDSASYSGGSGGTFTNLVSGQEAWTVQGATPTFTTEEGMEGVTFSGLTGETILGEQKALAEATIICICRAASAASNYAFGGANPTSETYGLLLNGYRLRAFTPGAGTDFTAAPSPNTVPHVYCASFSPLNGTKYAQVNDGTIVSKVEATGDWVNATAKDYQSRIGGSSDNLFTGWIGRVLVFSRALHYRDNANLQLLIASEMARVNL